MPDLKMFKIKFFLMYIKVIEKNHFLAIIFKRDILGGG